MATITIPKKLIKDDIVIIPRKEYEEFARWKKIVKVQINEQWFWTPEWQRKEAEAEVAIRVGRLHGPFSDYKKLISALKRKKK